MRILVVLGLAALVSACATVTESANNSVSPESANGSQWAIAAKAETGILYDDVAIYVNGTVAAKGRLGSSESDHHDVHIAGGYQNHIVLGICSRSDNDPVTYTCDISVDGAAVDTLSW